MMRSVGAYGSEYREGLHGCYGTIVRQCVRQCEGSNRIELNRREIWRMVGATTDQAKIIPVH